MWFKKSNNVVTFWEFFSEALAKAWYSAIPVAGRAVRELSSAHETGADRQPGAEPD
jgi:hypothetical protein